MSARDDSMSPTNTNMKSMGATAKANDKSRHKTKTCKSNSITNSSTTSGIYKIKRLDTIKSKKYNSTTNSSTTSGIPNAGSSQGSYRRPDYKSSIPDAEFDSVLFGHNTHEGTIRNRDLKANVESNLDINEPNADANLRDLKVQLENRIRTRKQIMNVTKQKIEKYRTHLSKMEDCHESLHIKHRILKEELKAANRQIKSLEASLAVYKREVYKLNYKFVTEPMMKHKYDTESMLKQNGSEDKMMITKQEVTSSKLSVTTEESMYGVEQDLIKMHLGWTNSPYSRDEAIGQHKKNSANQTCTVTRPSTVTQNENNCELGIMKEPLPLNFGYLTTEDQDGGSRNPYFKRSLSLQVKASHGHSKKSSASEKRTSNPDSHFRPSLTHQREMGDTDPLFKSSVSSPKIAKVAEPMYKQSPLTEKAASVDDNSLSSKQRFSVTVPELQQSLASLKKTNCGDYQFKKPLPVETIVGNDRKVNSRRGIPVANRHYEHSLCTGVGNKWLYHAPSKLVPMGTVMKPVVPESKAVTKEPKYRDITDSKTSKYCLIAQEQDTDGELETKLYKGNVVPTCGGGAQVIFNDIEMLKQSSPDVPKKVSSTITKFNY